MFIFTFFSMTLITFCLSAADIRSIKDAFEATYYESNSSEEYDADNEYDEEKRTTSKPTINVQTMHISSQLKKLLDEVNILSRPTLSEPQDLTHQAKRANQAFNLLHNKGSEIIGTLSNAEKALLFCKMGEHLQCVPGRKEEARKYFEAASRLSSEQATEQLKVQKP